MTTDVKQIMRSLELVHICCETIEDNGGCKACPMGLDCFEENSLLDSYERIPMGKWQKFFDFADDIDEWRREQDMTAQEKRELELWNHLDCVSKGVRDEEAIAEMYGW